MGARIATNPIHPQTAPFTLPGAHPSPLAKDWPHKSPKPHQPNTLTSCAARILFPAPRPLSSRACQVLREHETVKTPVSSGRNQPALIASNLIQNAHNEIERPKRRASRFRRGIHMDNILDDNLLEKIERAKAGCPTSRL